jgi:TonB-dependent SusC/RagA subfamily outer membrane receptor
MRKTATAGALLGVLGWLAACGGGSAAPPPSGTGMAPEENGTGAVKTVEADESQFFDTVQDMIQGRVAGLQVLDLPGCGVTLRIRGTTELRGDSQGGYLCDREPLLIIDDKPVAPGNMESALRALVPVQIDRIRVLKDVASTSVYGTRGAYGVVLIDTKR